MKYTIDDIPYLIGLHFRLTRVGERDWVYLIHSYKNGSIFVDWPHRRSGASLAEYSVNNFINKLNDNTWIITDLPSVDISSVIKEELDSLRTPKAGDVLIAREDLLYDVDKSRFATKDKEYPITEIEWGDPGNDGYIITDDNDSRHALSLGFIHKHFIIIDHTVNMDHIINQLFESNESNINKYRVGDKFYPIKSLYLNSEVNNPSKRFVTEGNIYEIIKIEPNYDWVEYGYRGNRYVVLTDNTTRANANHGFSDIYIDKNFVLVSGDSLLNIDDAFKQLYESEDSYKPKLNLKFNPPIEDVGELDKILETIHNTHPSVKWYGDNDILTYNPIGMKSHDDEEIQVHFLTIGYFPSKPNSLTYSSYVDDNEWVDTSVDGWEWLESKKINVDDVFNKLYESEEDDLGWVKDITQNIDYWKLLQIGQTVIIKPHHDPKQQEYFKATLMKCRKASTPFFYYGKTIKVRDIHEFDRRDIDCFTCEDFYLDCREQVKAIEASGFWVSSDMVDIEIIS